MNGITYSGLTAELLCKYFPEYKDRIRGLETELGDGIPHCLFGNFLNPLTVNILQELTEENIVTARKIFDLYELLASSSDEEVRDLLQVTLLENLWDNYDVYSAAVKFMGDNTRLINKEIGKYLSEPEKCGCGSRTGTQVTSQKQLKRRYK